MTAILLKHVPLLRAEGAAVLLASVWLYAHQGGWLLFALLFLAPDLSMLGYLRDETIGGKLYNLFHTYSIPILLSVAGALLDSSPGVRIGLIWTAHIGLDRMLGYGLKATTGFKDTHLGRIGRSMQ